MKMYQKHYHLSAHFIAWHMPRSKSNKYKMQFNIPLLPG
jgi:hypothetical protein